jgi:hypothetical protein
MIDEYGRTAQLSVMPAHRPDCTFGSGFYRLSFGDREVRYCQTWEDVQFACRLLDGVVPEVKVDRDGYCLADPFMTEWIGDANTPDVVDGEWWLGLSVADGMRELGLKSEADYAHVYRQIEAAVGRRNNRQSQSGVRASIVIKRPGTLVTEA